MLFDIISLSSSLQQKQAVLEIMQCNKITEQYTLIMTEQQAIELIRTRSYCLKSTGRIEFSGGIIKKIIKEFSSSPYIIQNNYAETIHELIEMFYYYKNETLDLVSDDALIKYMRKCFNGECHGSLDLLKTRELDKMARKIRSNRHNKRNKKVMGDDDSE